MAGYGGGLSLFSSGPRGSAHDEVSGANADW